ncbi:MAG: hypothetical protein QNK19_04595 [Xanthomonadales bacterium]|nr:hypothetical protein [Xanthomonadales bacterium]
MAAATPKIRYVLCLVAALSFVAPAAVSAESVQDAESNWYFQAGGYMHFSDDEEYEGPPWFAGIEYQKSRNRTIGLSVFNNSYGQFTQYAYVGKSFYPSDRYPGFRIKLTGGIVHGYTGEHQKIFPIRWGDGWGFAVVPGVGYQSDKWGFDVAVLSASGLLFLAGYEF